MGKQDRKKPGIAAPAATQTTPIVRSPKQDQVLRQLQQRFGNQVVDRLLLDAPSDAFEHYLADLLAAERATGEDFTPYLPGQAPQEWARFAQSWYRVLWAERSQAEPAALEVDAPPPAMEPQEPATIETVAPVQQALPDTPEVEKKELARGGSDPGDDNPVSDGTTVAFGGLALRKAAGSDGPDFDNPAELEAWFQDLQTRSGSGRPLSEAEQAFLSRVHGQNLSEARIHEGSAAQRAAQQIAARAFTVGSDIWMGEDADLRSKEGARLLAHEATHVIQNTTGRGATGSTRVSEPGQPLELEAESAEQVADQVWEQRRGAWAFVPPNGLDSRSEYLADWMLGQLPNNVGQAPSVLVREGLRSLLTQKAQRRLGEARLTLQSGLADDVYATEQDPIRGELSALARQVSHASAEREGLLFLLQVAGSPSIEELAGLEKNFAPYPGFADQLAATLASLTGEDLVADAVQGSDSADMEVDPQRGRATLDLVRQLAPQLGLSASGVDVHTDQAAAEKVRGLGTRGLAEDGAIYLDDEAFEPGTADARGLVAHELTHIAQEGLAPATHVNPGWAAEAEAAETAWRAASGGSLSAPEFGLPTGHVAAEGGVDASGVVASFNAKQTSVQGQSGGIARPQGGPAGGQDPNASEDSERKLEQYEDGVDGICEMIEDLDAFDDLCEAIDDDEPTSRHLNRVMANEHAGRLPKMWQGALEGGEVASQMQRAFNSEFDGRGFWEETELAFEMICREAKARATPEPEAAGAKAEAKDAESNAQDATRDANQGGEEGGDGVGGGTGADVAPVDPSIAAFLGSSVEDVAPTIGEFESFRSITDENFAAITDATTHRTAFCANPPDIEQGRGGQVMEALFENLIGSGVSSFTDQLVDGLVWDNVGKLGDMAVQGLTKGKLGTPFVGPIIQLAQNPPWTAGAWGFGEGGPFTSLGEGWDNLGNTLEGFNSAESAGDYLGLFCAVAADLFGMLRDLIDGICTVLSTLSALCYVVGGILIIVGIALLWLAGVGAPLVSAGGWLTRMGGILGRVNTVLEPVVIMLSGLVMVLRALAALMVPSDLYAQQLQGVGEDASTFGEKGGAKLGDMAAEATNEAIADAVSPRPRDGGTGDGETAGDGEDLSAQVEDSNQSELERVVQEAQEGLGDDDAPAPAEDTPAADEDGATPEDAAPAEDETRPDEDTPAEDGDGNSTASRVLSVLGKLTGVSNAVQGIQDGWNDAKQGFSDPARFAQEGLNPQLRAYVDGEMSDRILQLDAKAAEIQDQIRAIEDGTDTDSNMYDEERLHQELRVTREKIVSLHGDLTTQRDLIADIENQEQAALGEEDPNRADEDEARQNQEDAQQRLQELETERTQVDQDLESKRNELADAEIRLSDAQEQAHIDAHLEQERRNQAHDDATGQFEQDSAQHQADQQQSLNEMDRLNQQANDLNQQAQDTERARSHQAEADTARETADRIRADLIGRKVDVEVDGVSRSRSITDIQIDSDGNVTLTVEKTRGSPDPVQVSGDDIRNDRRHADAREMGEAHSEAETSQSQADDLLAPYGGEDRDPADLRNESDEARDRSQQERANWETAERQAPSRPTEDTSPLVDGTPVDQAQADIQRLNGAITRLETRQGEIPGEVDQATKEIQTDSIGRHQEHVQHVSGEYRDANQTVGDTLRSTSSGNAMGGTGSAYKDLGNALSGWVVELTGVMDKLPTHIAQSAHVQQQQQDGGSLGMVVESGAQTGLDAAFGLGHRETKEELNAIGQQQASVEQRRQSAVTALLECEAPVDYEAFAQHRVLATTAYEAYIRAHAEALRAYRAETIVGELAAGTGELAEQGKPIQAASASMAGPLAQSTATEDQRTAIISGADSEAPAADSSVAGIVVDLIAKIGDNSDEMDDQPSPGGPESGQQAADGQNLAKDEAANRTDQVQQASEQNRQFLDEAVSLQSAQQEDVTSNITALEARQQVELQIQNEIKAQKAAHLAERQAQRDIAAENASAFSNEYQQMEAWRVDYEAKKATVESEFS